MAIKIGNLNLKNEKSDHIFTDFTHRLFPSNSNSDTSLVKKNDLNAAYDLNAIKNEIQNLLNLPRYSRILNPDFGFDFLRWIGQPISQSFADMQRMNIVNILKSGSSRFTLTDLQIVAIPEQKLYYILMNITSPYFNGEQNITGFIDSSGSLITT